ncbi:hypothetical protein PIB30_061102 [Stylosanthes scabra]|uniref:Uncharacterized protein n=1 Tax=Stylosanthes scabra TaxID=79078 RepID=A0ABU6WLI2_9FABA|nr:hypothetical protein [Stylosanthes scabra]
MSFKDHPPHSPNFNPNVTLSLFSLKSAATHCRPLPLSHTPTFRLQSCQVGGGRSAVAVLPPSPASISRLFSPPTKLPWPPPLPCQTIADGVVKGGATHVSILRRPRSHEAAKPAVLFPRPSPPSLRLRRIPHFEFPDPGGGINQIPGERTISGDVRLTLFYKNGVKTLVSQSLLKKQLKMLLKLKRHMYMTL